MLLITGLILTGLIVDLGGGPDHSRRGFQVRPLPLSHLVPAGLLRRSICVLVLEEPWPYRRRRARQLGAHGPLLGHPFRLCPGCVLLPGYGARRDVRLFRPFIVLVAADLTLSSVCSAASETESPRTNIAKAVRRVFYRIVVFYVRASLYHSARHVDNTSDTDLGHPDHRHVGPVQRS